jgi:hypothetical protein
MYRKCSFAMHQKLERILFAACSLHTHDNDGEQTRTFLSYMDKSNATKSRIVHMHTSFFRRFSLSAEQMERKLLVGKMRLGLTLQMA